MATREIREKGVRRGFEVLNLATGGKGVLAWAKAGRGPRVGKYLVNLEDLERVGVQGVLEALREADVVLVDEVGPMELYSEAFRKAVERLMEAGKPAVVTIHYRARHPLLEKLRAAARGNIFEVKPESRQQTYEKLFEAVSTLLGFR